MQPNPTVALLRTMGALLIPFMGSASPVAAAVEPCWDAALLDDTSTKAASWPAVELACGALLCVESAFVGIKEMSSVLNNELPGSRDPRQGARCGHPSHTLEPDGWARQTVGPRPPRPSPAPFGATCCYSLLRCCSGSSDSCYQGRLFTLRISQWPPQPLSQHLCTSTDRQGGENKLTMSLHRHLNFTPHVYLKTSPFLPKQIWMKYSDTGSVLVVIPFSLHTK